MHWPSQSLWWACLLAQISSVKICEASSYSQCLPEGGPASPVGPINSQSPSPTSSWSPPTFPAPPSGQQSSSAWAHVGSGLSAGSWGNLSPTSPQTSGWSIPGETPSSGGPPSPPSSKDLGWPENKWTNTLYMTDYITYATTQWFTTCNTFVSNITTTSSVTYTTTVVSTVTTTSPTTTTTISDSTTTTTTTSDTTTTTTSDSTTTETTTTTTTSLSTTTTTTSTTATSFTSLPTGCNPLGAQPTFYLEVISGTGLVGTYATVESFGSDDFVTFESGATYTFTFNDECQLVDTSDSFPSYTQTDSVLSVVVLTQSPGSDYVPVTCNIVAGELQCDSAVGGDLQSCVTDGSPTLWIGSFVDVADGCVAITLQAQYVS